jgi:hypothetical protein
MKRLVNQMHATTSTATSLAAANLRVGGTRSPETLILNVGISCRVPPRSYQYPKTPSNPANPHTYPSTVSHAEPRRIRLSAADHSARKKDFNRRKSIEIPLNVLNYRSATPESRAIAIRLQPRSRFFLLFGLAEIFPTKFLLEPLYTTQRIDKLLLTGKKRV